MLVALMFLGCVASSLAQGFLSNLGNLSDIGTDIGGRVGSDIGGGIGSVLDTGGILGGATKLPGLGGGKIPAVRPDGKRPGHNKNEGYPASDTYGGRGYKDGSSSSGRRDYEAQGSSDEFDDEVRYDGERTVSEKEHGGRFEAGRGGQGKARGGDKGRSDNYGRGASNYGKG